MANRWWDSVYEAKPNWMKGILGGEPVHCQMLVLSGKRSQGITEKGTGEKESWEREDWSGIPSESSQSRGEGQAQALPQHQGGIIEPGVRDKAGGFPSE